MTTLTVPLTDTAVALRGISRIYGRGSAAVRAVDDVTIDFPRGGWTAVMGPSGSGKSTLLHCAAGLERVDAGQVLLGDTDITTAGDRELTALRRTRVGFVFQSFNLIGSLTAAQNVALPLQLARRRRAGRPREAPAGGAVGRAAAAGRHRPRHGDPARRAVRRRTDGRARLRRRPHSARSDARDGRRWPEHR